MHLTSPNEAIPENEQPKAIGNARYAAAMMHNMANLVRLYSKKDVPCAQAFQQCTEVLDPKMAQTAASYSRSEWLKQMQAVENQEIGAVRQWLQRVMGNSQPLLQQSIDWIQEHGDHNNTAVQMLLADLQMETGEEEAAKKTYATALRNLRDAESTETVWE